MRVIAGKLGGRRLSAGKGEVRPSADRVREAVFSMLREIDGSVVLDLFCGSGAYGIEALSRGAASAVLVDTDTGPAGENVDALGLEACSRLARTDAVGFAASEAGRFDLVFCDPPYRIAARMAAELDPLLPRLLAPGARVVVESSTREPMDLTLPLARERTYGDTMIRIYETGAAE